MIIVDPVGEGRQLDHSNLHDIISLGLSYFKIERKIAVFQGSEYFSVAFFTEV